MKKIINVKQHYPSTKEYGLLEHLVLSRIKTFRYTGDEAGITCIHFAGDKSNTIFLDSKKEIYNALLEAFKDVDEDNPQCDRLNELENSYLDMKNISEKRLDYIKTQRTLIAEKVELIKTLKNTIAEYEVLSNDRLNETIKLQKEIDKLKCSQKQK